MPSYATAAELQSWLRTDTTDGTVHALVLDAVEEQIDMFCGRARGAFATAGTVASARVFTAEDTTLLRVDDIGSTTDLVVAVDLDFDGTFETTVTSASFQTEPLNAITKGRAIERLRMRSTSSYYWPISAGDALVQVTARWGWPAIPDVVKHATLLQASRLVKRREAPFGVVVNPDLATGERLFARLDPDVEMMLIPLQRNRGGILT